MAKIRKVMGISKFLFNTKMKVYVFFHFFPEFLKGNISLRRFTLFLKRLLFFLSKMQHNKFVEIEKKTRFDLYVPGFPSKAFYTACHKFIEFDKKMPCTTVLISVTSACSYNCNHCYQKMDIGKDVDIMLLIHTIKKLQNMGVAFFNIEGGEPFLAYDRLKKICTVIDNRSEIWINATGVGMTLKRLLELKKLNVTAVMFSLHSSDPDRFNKFMGNNAAWDYLVKGIDMCHKAGIAVAFNSCLMKEDYYNGTFEKIMNLAKDFNAAIVQIIKPKPSGGWIEKEDIVFTQKDIHFITEKIHMYNNRYAFKQYPSISAQIIEENKMVFGCTAGGIDRFYINAKGDVQPCEFLNISFGNIAKENFEVIYKRMRDCFEWGGDCHLCEKYAKKIACIYKKHHLSSLPLPLNLSKHVYDSWNRGNKTDLYEQLKRLK